MTEHSKEFRYFDLDGEIQTIELPAGSFAFLVCQVPVVYQASSESKVEVTLGNGNPLVFPDMRLDADTTKLLVSRSGLVQQISVFVSEE